MRKIIVCDDVELERQLLKDILHEYFEEIHEEICVEEYSSGEVLVADAEEGYLEGELLFLDIYMVWKQPENFVRFPAIYRLYF